MPDDVPVAGHLHHAVRIERAADGRLGRITRPVGELDPPPPGHGNAEGEQVGAMDVVGAEQGIVRSAGLASPVDTVSARAATCCPYRSVSTRDSRLRAVLAGAANLGSAAAAPRARARTSASSSVKRSAGRLSSRTRRTPPCRPARTSSTAPNSAARSRSRRTVRSETPGRGEFADRRAVGPAQQVDQPSGAVHAQILPGNLDMECPGCCLAWERHGPPGFVAREKTTDDPDPVHHRHPRLRGRRPAHASAVDPLSRCPPNTDFARGTSGEYLPELVRYWAEEYDWSARQAELNQIPQFTAEIDGRPIHFLSARSERRTRHRCCSCTAGRQPVPLPDRHPPAHRPAGRAAGLPRHRPLPARIPLLRPRGAVVRRDGRPAGHVDDRGTRPREVPRRRRRRRHRRRDGSGRRHPGLVVGLHLTNVDYPTGQEPDLSEAEQQYAAYIQQWWYTQGAYAAVQSTNP